MFYPLLICFKFNLITFQKFWWNISSTWNNRKIHGGFSIHLYAVCSMLVCLDALFVESHALHVLEHAHPLLIKETLCGDHGITGHAWTVDVFASAWDWKSFLDCNVGREECVMGLGERKGNSFRNWRLNSTSYVLTRARFPCASIKQVDGVFDSSRHGNRIHPILRRCQCMRVDCRLAWNGFTMASYLFFA